MISHPTRQEAGRYSKIPSKSFCDAGEDGGVKVKPSEYVSLLVVVVVVVVVVGGERNELSNALHHHAV